MKKNPPKFCEINRGQTLEARPGSDRVGFEPGKLYQVIRVMGTQAIIKSPDKVEMLAFDDDFNDGHFRICQVTERSKDATRDNQQAL